MAKDYHSLLFSYILGLGDYSYRLLFRKILKHRIQRTHIGNKYIMESLETENFIKEKLKQGQPLMVARLGSAELAAVDKSFRKCLGLTNKISDSTIHNLCNNAGFFPKDEKFVMNFI